MISNLDMFAMDAVTAITGVEDFDDIGDRRSFSAAGQVGLAIVGKDTIVYVNTDTDQTPEAVMMLKGIRHLSDDNFLV